MSQHLESLEDLHVFLQSAAKRANHHAKEVESVLYTLIGGLLVNSNQLTSIKIRKNILWARVKNRDLVFAYNHEKRTIEVRDRTQRGTVLASFHDHPSSSEQVFSFFETLGEET